MKHLLQLAIILFITPLVHGTQFSLSYFFVDGMEMRACFEGDLEDNLIRNIESIDMCVTGSWFVDGEIVLTRNQSYTTGGYALQDGGAFMSLDGSITNFRFSSQNKVGPDEDWDDRNVVWFAHSPSNTFALYWYVAGDNYVFEADRWELTYEGATVPDRGPGLPALVAGLAALALGYRRRRRR